MDVTKESSRIANLMTVAVAVLATDKSLLGTLSRLLVPELVALVTLLGARIVVPVPVPDAEIVKNTVVPPPVGRIAGRISGCCGDARPSLGITPQKESSKSY